VLKEDCGGLTLANNQVPTQLLTPSFLPSCSGRTEGENRMRKVMGQDKDRDIACQSPLQAKQNQQGKINVIYCQLK